MKPVKRNLECWQGVTFDFPLFFADANFTPTNLNGYTARMQVRPSISSEDVTIELTTENGRILIDSEHGGLSLYISAEDASSIPTGSYKYDLELVAASGRVYKPIYGSFKVKGEVTR